MGSVAALPTFTLKKYYEWSSTVSNVKSIFIMINELLVGKT